MKQKLVNKKYTFVSITILVAISLFLRIFYLNHYPPSLNWDEVSHGYNAYSILKTGKDEWGKYIPLIFRAYGDYKLPLYIYTSIISISIFGLNAFAVRLPSAMAGVGTVIFTYFLAIEIFGGFINIKKVQVKNIALLPALLVAIEPWSLFLSRGAFEANLALILFTGGVYFLFLSLRKPKSFWISSILLGLSVWTYNSYRIFTPLVLFVFLIIYREQFIEIWKKDKKPFLLSLLILATFLIPMFVQLSLNVGQARYSKVSIIDEGAINLINEKRLNTDLNPYLERVIYNKGTYFLFSFINNWLSHYSPNFLFINGGDQYQFSVQDHGLLYLVNLPFLLLGIVLLIRAAWKKDKPALFLLSWFLLAPIPASITRESPHVLRSITILPMPMLFTTYGFFKVLSTKNLKWFVSKKLFSIVYLLILFVSFVNYTFVYSNEYRVDYSWSWQYGYREAVEYIKSVYNKYDKIIITKKYGEPHEFVLFYWPWDPQVYRNDPNLTRFEQSNWFWVDRFDKFYFVNDWDIPKESNVNFTLESGGEFDCDDSTCLLVTSPGNYHRDWKLLETIYFLDGNPAFEILEN